MHTTIQHIDTASRTRTRRWLRRAGFVSHDAVFERIASRRQLERETGVLVKSKGGKRRQEEQGGVAQREHNRGLEQYLVRAIAVELLRESDVGRLRDDDIDTWEKLYLEEDIRNNTAEPERDGDLPVADPISLEPINEKYGVIWLPAANRQENLGGFLFSAPTLLKALYNNARNPMTREKITAEAFDLIKQVDAEGDPNFPVIDADEPVDYPALFKAIAKAWLTGVQSWSVETRGDRVRAVRALTTAFRNDAFELKAGYAIDGTDGSTEYFVVFTPDPDDVAALSQELANRINVQRRKAAAIAARIAGESQGLSGEDLDAAEALAANNVRLFHVGEIAYANVDSRPELSDFATRLSDEDVDAMIETVVSGDPSKKFTIESINVWVFFWLGKGEFRLQTGGVGGESDEESGSDESISFVDFIAELGEGFPQYRAEIDRYMRISVQGTRYANTTSFRTPVFSQANASNPAFPYSVFEAISPSQTVTLGHTIVELLANTKVVNFDAIDRASQFDSRIQGFASSNFPDVLASMLRYGLAVEYQSRSYMVPGRPATFIAILRSAISGQSPLVRIIQLGNPYYNELESFVDDINLENYIVLDTDGKRLIDLSRILSRIVPSGFNSDKSPEEALRRLFIEDKIGDSYRHAPYNGYIFDNSTIFF